MLVALCLKALEATTVDGSQNVYNTVTGSLKKVWLLSCWILPGNL